MKKIIDFVVTGKKRNYFLNDSFYSPVSHKFEINYIKLNYFEGINLISTLLFFECSSVLQLFLQSILGCDSPNPLISIELLDITFCFTNSDFTAFARFSDNF